MRSYHKNIKFTTKIETKKRILFLDFLLISSNSLISTTVHKKNKNTNIHMNWRSSAQNNWKRGTLKTLTTKASDICSTDKYLRKELEHIRTVLHQRNKYPLWVVNHVIDDAKKVVMIKFTVTMN